MNCNDYVQNKSNVGKKIVDKNQIQTKYDFLERDALIQYAMNKWKWVQTEL